MSLAFYLHLAFSKIVYASLNMLRALVIGLSYVLS
jgi:hypothetical protein